MTKKEKELLIAILHRLSSLANDPVTRQVVDDLEKSFSWAHPCGRLPMNIDTSSPDLGQPALSIS